MNVTSERGEIDNPEYVFIVSESFQLWGDKARRGLTKLGGYSDLGIPALIEAEFLSLSKPDLEMRSRTQWRNLSAPAFNDAASCRLESKTHLTLGKAILLDPL